MLYNTLKKIWSAYFLASITGYGYVQIIPGWGEFKRSLVKGIIRVAYNFRKAKLQAFGYIPESNTREYARGKLRLKTPGLYGGTVHGRGDRRGDHLREISVVGGQG